MAGSIVVLHRNSAPVHHSPGALSTKLEIITGWQVVYIVLHRNSAPVHHSPGALSTKLDRVAGSIYCVT